MRGHTSEGRIAGTEGGNKRRLKRGEKEGLVIQEMTGKLQLKQKMRRIQRLGETEVNGEVLES